VSGADVLTERALNRATLARQYLLERSPVPTLTAITHLVGLQAQIPLNPYVGLWSRLVDFDPEPLSQLLLDREVVRIVVMRGTLHLVTADDALVLRPLVQPVLDRELERHSEHAPKLREVDLAPVLEFACTLFAERPRSGPELRRALAAAFPDLDAAALAYACRNHLALVQVPPRGLWGKSAQVTTTTVEAWLGRALVPAPSIDDVVLRYFAAFGPASVADVSSWSRLTGMREVVDRLAPRLRPFRTEAGRELFDLPDAPRPDPDVPAPPRVLPEYDNVLLSHADRSRFVADTSRADLGEGRAVHGTVLEDGRLAATWHYARAIGAAPATLFVAPLHHVSGQVLESVAAEAARFLAFYAADATEHAVEIRPVRPAD
jgi:hypothetical protein